MSLPWFEDPEPSTKYDHAPWCCPGSPPDGRLDRSDFETSVSQRWEPAFFASMEMQMLRNETARRMGRAPIQGTKLAYPNTPWDWRKFNLLYYRGGLRGLVGIHSSPISRVWLGQNLGAPPSGANIAHSKSPEHRRNP